MGQFNAEWPEVLERFQLAEELGFDYAWLVDHFIDTNDRPDVSCMEAWTLLAALAASTSRIGLGVLVSSNTFRHPALLMKEAVTVDRISGGRLLLGLGAGWYEREHSMYGLPFGSNSERVEQLEETVQIARSLMTQDLTTFAGRHYQLRDAEFNPKPAQQPHIPIVIGAHRPRMLRLTARYADMWDTFATVPQSATEGVDTELADRAAMLDQYCREAGRDPVEVRRSTWTGGEVLRSEEQYLSWVDNHLSTGFTDFSCGLPGPQHEDSLRRIATEVIPALRAGSL